MNDTAVTRYLYGMIIVPKFELKYNEEKGIHTIISLTPCNCPLCGGAVYHRDHKGRDVKRMNGEVWHFNLRRLLCDNCKKLHTEIPDIIQPYKHYDTETIQSVLDGGEKAKECVADESTISRWKADFARAEPDIEQRLASVCAQDTNEVTPLLTPGLAITAVRATIERWLAFVMHLLINAGHKLCTQFAFCPPYPCDRLHNAGTKSKGGYGEIVKTITDTG